MANDNYQRHCNGAGVEPAPAAPQAADAQRVILAALAHNAQEDGNGEV